MYFPDAAAALAGDTVLAAVPAERRHTPIATATGRGRQFDIRARWRETVFFE
jgi:protocatechuate 3,4-dioxygenase beta subunit